MLKILTVFGTRPEAIKMAPVISELESVFDVDICVTGQHKSMLDQVMQAFSIVADYDFNIMSENQSLSELSAKVIIELDKVLTTIRPDFVLVQGDTTTALSTAITSFYNGIRVGHIEAGLRTRNPSSPFPEEVNRQLIARLADLHFAPTTKAKDNLLEEGISAEKIHVTGNTVVDALIMADRKSRIVDFPPELYASVPLLNYAEVDRPVIILVTSHRREHFGSTFENICTAIRTIAKKNPDVAVIFPVHLNPNVQQPVNRLLSNVENIYLIPPVDYISFVKLLGLCNFILTDSGGIQEEAPSLGKPVLVMRKDTERPEGVASGTARVIGVNCNGIIESVELLLNNHEEYESMSKAKNPYGDGKASKRIRRILEAAIS